MLPIQALQRHEKPVHAMALCQDSVFTGSEDMEIKVTGGFSWDICGNILLYPPPPPPQRKGKRSVPDREGSKFRRFWLLQNVFILLRRYFDISSSDIAEIQKLFLVGMEPQNNVPVVSSC